MDETTILPKGAIVIRATRRAVQVRLGKTTFWIDRGLLRQMDEKARAAVFARHFGDWQEANR